MALGSYNAVIKRDTSTFNNPRQKTWGVWISGSSGWSIGLISANWNEVKRFVLNYINTGGQYASINNIVVGEIVPIDTAFLPNV